MMYIEFMKNFLLPDSSEVMAVRLILESWAQKTSDSYFVDMMYVEFMKIFFSPFRAIWWLLHSFWHPEPKNHWFLLCRDDVRRVHENFLLADSSELMAVRLILASWAQKHVIPSL